MRKRNNQDAFGDLLGEAKRLMDASKSLMDAVQEMPRDDAFSGLGAVMTHLARDSGMCPRAVIGRIVRSVVTLVDIGAWDCDCDMCHALGPLEGAP